MWVNAAQTGEIILGRIFHRRIEILCAAILCFGRFTDYLCVVFICLAFIWAACGSDRLRILDFCCDANSAITFLYIRLVCQFVHVPDSVICGVIGAMTAEKGIDSLAAIAIALPPEVRDRARLLLLGGTRQGAARIGGIPAHFAGFVDEIAAATAGLDILWHPSRIEGLGTSVIDAMALGIPPVAFAVGGLPEVVENGVSGILIAAEDTKAFAEGARALIADIALRSRLSEGARRKARHFGAERMTEQTEAVYQGLLPG